MVGTVGRGRVAAIKESTLNSFTTIEVSDRCRKNKGRSYSRLISHVKDLSETTDKPVN